jgi:hypothetical protein
VASETNSGGWVSVALDGAASVKWRSRAWREISTISKPPTPHSAQNQWALRFFGMSELLQWALRFLNFPELVRIAPTCRVFLHAALASASATKGFLKLTATSGAAFVARITAFRAAFGVPGFLCSAQFVELKPYYVCNAEQTLCHGCNWDGGLLPLCTSIEGLTACFDMPYTYYMCDERTQGKHRAIAGALLRSLSQNNTKLRQLCVRFDATEESLKSLLCFKHLQVVDLRILRHYGTDVQAEEEALRYYYTEAPLFGTDISSVLSSAIRNLPSLTAFTYKTSYFNMRGGSDTLLELKSASLECFEALQEKALKIASLNCPRMKKICLMDCGGSRFGSDLLPPIGRGCPNLQICQVNTPISLYNFNTLAVCQHLRLLDVTLESTLRSESDDEDEPEAHETSIRLEFPALVVLSLSSYFGAFPDMTIVDCPMLKFAHFDAMVRNSGGDRGHVCMTTVISGSPSIEVLDVVNLVSGNKTWCKGIHDAGSVDCLQWGRTVSHTAVAPGDCMSVRTCMQLRQDVYRRLYSECHDQLLLPIKADGTQVGSRWSGLSSFDRTFVSENSTRNQKAGLFF